GTFHYAESFREQRKCLILHRMRLEGRADREPELELALRLQSVVEHAAPLRIHCKNEAERNVQHRHEEAHFGAGRRLEILQVEVEQLIAAENQAGDRIGRSDRPDVESAYAVLAPEEQLLENRQIGRALELVDVLILRPKAERQPARVLQVPHALDERLVEIGV